MSASLLEFLEQNIKQHPDQHSLCFLTEDHQESISDAELIAQAKTLASALQQFGLQARNRVVILGENSLQWMICYLAVLYAKGVAVTLDTELLEESTQQLINKMDPYFIFCSTAQRYKIKDCLIPIVFMNSTANMCNALSSLTKKAPVVEQDYEDQIASIVNSSGTGGRLKGILLSHQNIIDVVTLYKNEFQRNHIKNILCVLPCFAIYPCSIALAALANGIPIYFADPKKIELVSALQNNAIHCLPMVPLGISKIHEAIMNKVKAQGRLISSVVSFLTYFSCLVRRMTGIKLGKNLFRSIHKTLGNELEMILTGGAPLNPTITKDFYAWGFTIKEGYGLTETSGVIAVTDGSYSSIGSCGIPLPGVNININAMNKGQNGEILLYTSRLMAGYFRDPEANADSLMNEVFLYGRFRTLR